MLFRSLPKDFELLSIDIDSCDYQVWQSIEHYKPKLVIIEIDSTHKENEDSIYDSHNNKYKFLLQRAIDNKKKLKDSDDNTICVICLEQIPDNDKLILCVLCNKYIGHSTCVATSYRAIPKCPYCNGV